MLITILALAASTPATVIGTPPALAASPAAARQSRDGIEFVAVTISDDGLVVGCQAKLANGTAYEDRSNCRELGKARFEPARDDKGQSVYSTMTLALTWHSMTAVRDQVTDAPTAGIANPDAVYLALNHMPPAMTGTVGAGIRVVLDSAGAVTDCEITRSSGNASLDRLACASGPAMAHLTALTGADGRPVRSLRLLQVNFSTQS